MTHHLAEVKNKCKLHLSAFPMCLRGLYRVNITLENFTNDNGAPRHCCASSCCQHTSLLSCGFCVSSLALNRSETLIRNRSCCCCCCCRICLALRAYVHRNGPMISLTLHQLLCCPQRDAAGRCTSTFTSRGIECFTESNFAQTRLEFYRSV